jgi:hypothetical protein
MILFQNGKQLGQSGVLTKEEIIKTILEAINNDFFKIFFFLSLFIVNSKNLNYKPIYLKIHSFIEMENKSTDIFPILVTYGKPSPI